MVCRGTNAWGDTLYSVSSASCIALARSADRARSDVRSDDNKCAQAERFKRDMVVCAIRTPSGMSSL
jgi:hypothetical protein